MLYDKVAQAAADFGLLHRVAHGPATGIDSLVQTDGGAVPTVARQLAGLSAFNLRGNWAQGADYALRDVVNVNGIAVACVIPHVAANFTEDFEAGRWVVHQGVTRESLQSRASANEGGGAVGHNSALDYVIGSLSRALADRGEVCPSDAPWCAEFSGTEADTALVQACIDFAAGRYTVVLPAGDLYLFKGLRVPSNSCLKGRGKGVTFLRLADIAAADENVITNSSNTRDAITNTGNENIVIADLTVDGNYQRLGGDIPHIGGVGGCGVGFAYVTGGLISRVGWLNPVTHGIDVSASVYSDINSTAPGAGETYMPGPSSFVRVEYCSGKWHGDDGITMHHVHDCEIVFPVAIESRGHYTRGNSNGVEIDGGCRRVNVWGGIVMFCDKGLQIKGHRGEPAPSDIKVFGFTAEYCVRNYEIRHQGHEVAGEPVSTTARGVSLYGCTSIDPQWQDDVELPPRALQVAGYSEVDIENFTAIGGGVVPNGIPDVDGDGTTKTAIGIFRGARNVTLRNLNMRGVLNAERLLHIGGSGRGNVKVDGANFADCAGEAIVLTAPQSDIRIKGVRANTNVSTAPACALRATTAPGSGDYEIEDFRCSGYAAAYILGTTPPVAYPLPVDILRRDAQFFGGTKIQEAVAAANAPLAPPIVVQKKLMELFTGYADSGPQARLFAGAERPPQGIAYFKRLDGSERVILMQQSSGNAMEVSERHILLEYELQRDGSIGRPIAISPELSIGHQGLSARVTPTGEVYLYSQMPAVAGQEGADFGRGVCRVLWKGENTTQGDVKIFQVFGSPGTADQFSYYRGATACVSTDGKYFVLVAGDTDTGLVEDTVPYLFVWDRVAVESAANPLTVPPVGYAMLAASSPVRTPLQGVVSDGRYIWVLRGFTGPLGQHVVEMYDMAGRLLREILVDDARAQYGRSGLFDNPDLGNPQSMEPQGMTIRGNRLLLVVVDFWRLGSQIVTQGGKNWACIVQSSLGQVPNRSDVSWVFTTKPANAGAWNATTVYTYGAISRRAKLVYELGAPLNEAGEQPISSGITRRISGASVALRQNPVDFSAPPGEDILFTDYIEQDESYIPRFSHSGASFRLYDPRDGSSTGYSYIEADRSAGNEVLRLRAGSSGLSGGAGIDLIGTGAASNAGNAYIYSRNGTTSATYGVAVQGADGAFRPYLPDVQNLGTQTAFRFGRGFLNSLSLGPAGTSAFMTFGTGTPEGVVSAPVGSWYMRIDGSAGTYWYRKNSGTGNTGWLAVF